MAQPSSYLHGGVVEGNERGEEVQVTSSEDQSKQDLALPRDTWMGQPV